MKKLATWENNGSHHSDKQKIIGLSSDACVIVYSLGACACLHLYVCMLVCEGIDLGRYTFKLL